MKFEDELKEYFDSAAKEMIPNMKESAFVMTILSGSIDPKICLELGATILLEKPLMLVVAKGTWIPPKLRALADEIVEADGGFNNAATIAKTQQAIDRMLNRPKQ